MWGSPWRSHLDLEQAPELFSNGHVWETETNSHGANAAAASCGTHIGAATAAIVPLPSAAPSSEAQGGSSEAATAVEEAVVLATFLQVYRGRVPLCMREAAR